MHLYLGAVQCYKPAILALPPSRAPQGGEILESAWHSIGLGRLGMKKCFSCTRCTTVPFEDTLRNQSPFGVLSTSLHPLSTA